MLSHFVGSPLTNCAEERNPLSTDGNAMKEAEKQRGKERASKEKWYVTRMAARPFVRCVKAAKNDNVIQVGLLNLIGRG